VAGAHHSSVTVIVNTWSASALAVTEILSSRLVILTLEFITKFCIILWSLCKVEKCKKNVRRILYSSAYSRQTRLFICYRPSNTVGPIHLNYRIRTITNKVLHLTDNLIHFFTKIRPGWVLFVTNYLYIILLIIFFVFLFIVWDGISDRTVRTSILLWIHFHKDIWPIHLFLISNKLQIP